MSSKEGIRYRILRSIATTVYHLAWPIVIFSVFLGVFSVYIAVKGFSPLHIRKLTFSGNPNDLLRSDASYHKNYLEYTRQFRPEEDYVIVVSGEDFEKNKACVEFLASLLKEKQDLFKNIFYKLDFGEVAKSRGLLFLEVPQLEDIEKQIGEFSGLLGKEQFTLDLNSLLSVASTKFDPKYLRQAGKDPRMEESLDSFSREFVESLTSLADRLEGKTEKPPVQFGNFLAENSDFAVLQKKAALHEYLSMEDGKILIMQIPSPNKEASFGDHAYAIEPLKEAIQKARNQFPNLEIGLTGEPALSEDQELATTRDSTIASIATFILIAVLFWFSFRGYSRPSMALFTLVLAVLWTLGFTTIAIGRLNILSMAFIPMILGLGIDFGIQILGRYEEELPRNSDVIGAIVQTIMHTGNAILTGASTTAVAFYTMCFNDFKGLSEMGLIGGTGIVFCVIGNMVLFPALLTLRDRRKLSKKGPVSVVSSGKGKLFDRIILDHAWTIIFLSLILTLISIFQISRIWFDYNLLNLQNENLESVRFEHILLKSQDARSVMFAADICENLEEAADHVEKFKKLPSVFDVISLIEIVPKNQDEKLRVISRIKDRLENIQLPQSGVKVNVKQNIEVLNQLRTNCDKMNKLARKWAAKEQRKEAEEFFTGLISVMDRCLKILSSMSQKEAEAILTSYQTQVFGELRKNLEQLKSQKVDRPIREEDIPVTLRNRYVGKNGKILIEVYPKENVWDREPLTRFVADLRSVNPDITGTPVQNYEYIELLKISYEKAGINALIAIVLLILIHFRTPKYIFPTLLPLVLGITWTLGIMPLINLPFNPANIITLPLVIGIGVAFGVYAVDRYRENSSPALFSTSTGKAILLSALTTIFGFGSLAFASDPSLSSLGKLMTIGVVICLITSLYVCPAVLQVLKRRKVR